MLNKVVLSQKWLAMLEEEEEERMGEEEGRREKFPPPLGMRGVVGETGAALGTEAACSSICNLDSTEPQRSTNLTTD